MFGIGECQVYLAAGATDLRRSIDGLAAWVATVLQQTPCSPHLFVFCNRQRDKVKILQWDHNGFWLHYRRLETGRFPWPEAGGVAVVVSRRELAWLLDGLVLHPGQGHAVLRGRRVN